LDRTTPQNSSRQLSHLTMQSPTTAQLGAAIVGLEPFGEHINHAAANTAIGWPEAQHYDHHAANIEARTIEQTDRIQTVGAQWNSGVTNCCRGEGSVFFIMFNTGHALPLPGGRSSCPQRSRGRDATCPRENNDLCPRTRTVHISDPATDSPQSRNVHVDEQSANWPRPRTGIGLDSPQSRIGNGRELSMDSPRTRIVHVPVRAMSSICLRPAIVRNTARRSRTEAMPGGATKNEAAELLRFSRSNVRKNQSSSGIMIVMAGFGSSMFSGPQVATSFTSLGARLSFLT